MMTTRSVLQFGRLLLSPTYLGQHRFGSVRRASPYSVRPSTSLRGPVRNRGSNER